MGRRIFAFISDFILYLIFFWVSAQLVHFIIDLFYYNDKVIEIGGMLHLTAVVFYYFIFEIIFFTSPGKWLYNLKIKSFSGSKPKRIYLFCRAFFKMLNILSIIGIPLVLILWYYQGHIWYDYGCGLYIAHEKTNKLTKIQKEWRKRFR